MKVGRNDKCPCGSGKKYKKCCMGKEKQLMGTLQHVFDFGSTDPFAARMMFQIFEIRDFIFKPDEIDAFDKAYDPFLKNITETKLVMEKCIALINKHVEGIVSGKLARINGSAINVDESIDADLNIWFKDFFIRGNMATKNLIRLAEFFGYKISFMLGDPDKFEKGKKKFLETHVGDLNKYFLDMIEDHRKKWYGPFANFRAKIEHDGFSVPNIRYKFSEGKITPIIAKFDSLEIEQFLKALWENIFFFCEDIVILLMSSKVPKEFAIMHIPENQRDPQMPIRYKIVMGMPKDVKKVEYKNISTSDKNIN